MDEMKIIHHEEFGDLNIAVIEGKEYFPATMCAEKLGYKKPADAVRTHCKGVCEMKTPTNGGIQKVKYIPEGDLYRLIAHSRLPSAEKFERWVFDEVLPEIRRTGGYSGGVMESIPRLVSAAVREVLPDILREIQGKDLKGKKRNRSHGKIDKLPRDLKEKVIYMLYVEKDTYEDIQLFLKGQGYEVHYSSIGRFNRRVVDEMDTFLG